MMQEVVRRDVPVVHAHEPHGVHGAIGDDLFSDQREAGRLFWSRWGLARCGRIGGRRGRCCGVDSDWVSSGWGVKVVAVDELRPVQPATSTLATRAGRIVARCFLMTPSCV